MPSLEQFGQTIKQKYPQYSQYSDAEIGSRMLQKYPQYKNRVTQTPATPFSNVTPKFQGQQFNQNDGNAPTRALGGAARFLGMDKFGQGLEVAARTATGEMNQVPQQQAALTKDASALIKALHDPRTPAANKPRLLEALKRTNGGVTAADIDPGVNLSNRDVIGSAAKTASYLLPGSKGLALFGAAEGVEQGKGVIGTALTSAGYVLGGKLLDKATSALFQKVFPAASQWLEKINLRLTPSQKARLGSTLKEVTDYLSKQKLVGSPETRFEKLDNIYDQTESKLQNFLNETAKGKTVTRDALVQKLNELKSQFKDDADSLSIAKQIDQAKLTLEKNFQKDIPLNRLNTLKRSTYKNAYNKAGDKVRDDVEKAIGDVYRQFIEKATEGLKIAGKDIAQFNKEYGTIIKARDLLKIAQGRNQLGWTGRLISGILGSGISAHFGGGPLADAAAFGAGEIGGGVVAGTPTRSAIGAGMRTLSKIKPKGVSRAAAPLFSNLSQ